MACCKTTLWAIVKMHFVVFNQGSARKENCFDLNCTSRLFIQMSHDIFRRMKHFDFEWGKLFDVDKTYSHNCFIQIKLQF